MKMRYQHVAIIIFLYTFIFGLNAQSGNKDYSDTPIPNNGPNIIFIYVDDLGYGDLGNFWQNQRTGDRKMVTPHLDVLANEGAMLTHHYTAAPVCAPARASLLEGLHQGHSSIRNSQFDKAIKNGLSMPEILARAGYRTMHIGKAGLAGRRNLNTDPFPDPSTLVAHPLKRGFDQFYGYLYHNQGHHHYPENASTAKYAYFTNGYTMILNGTELTYTTDVFTAKTKHWIATHETTRPEQPFFLYLAYDAPHAALQVPTQAYPSGGGLTGGLQWTSELSPTPWVNTASGVKDSYIHPDYASENWTITAKRHATMIRRIDDAVNDIIQLLKDLNIDNNTLIVFSSDNGPHNESGSGSYTQDPQFFQSYANFNGIKRDLWEGGIRMSTICRYPGVIPTNSQVTFPSGQWDWLATFADLAQVPIPAYTDGVSLMPWLKQNANTQVNKGFTYHEFAFNGSTPSYSDFEVAKRGRTRKQMQVIRMGDYKGVRYNIVNATDPFEIYNVITDERETIDLAGSMPELQQQMQDKVLQVRKKESTASRPYDDVPIPAVNVLGLTNGLNKKRYTGNYNWVPNFEYLSPVNNTVVSGMDISSEDNTSELGLYYKGYISIPSDGYYTFYLQSGSNCHFMLHEIHLINNDFNYTGSELSESVYLKSGFHPIRIFYQQNAQATPNMTLKLAGPGIMKADIPDSMFFVESTLGLKELQSNDDISLFPNPVNDKLKVTIKNTTSTNYKVSLYSVMGQQVINKNIESSLNTGKHTIEIPTHNLKAGLYFLKITFGNSNVVKKTIKK